MLDRVFTTISRYNMLAPGERVIAAVSGGPDSVCLLDILAALAPRLNFTLAGVAHFNHKLRAEESDTDEQLAAAMAARYAIPFYRAQPDGPLDHGNLEQEARRARRKFFAHLIDAGNATRVALGHTRDDQAETVLLRLLRGSGLRGLAGILPVTREGLIRPLLDCTRADVEAYLRAKEIPWREDQSNSDRRFTRNRIRHDLLPNLATHYNPQISASLAQLAGLAQDEESWWQCEIERLAPALLQTGPLGVEIRAPELAALPKAVSRRLVRHAIGLAKGNLARIEFQHVEQILDLASGTTGTGQAKLAGVTATRSLDWLRLASGPCALRIEPVHVEAPGHYAWAQGSTQIVLEIAERKGSFAPNQGRNPYGTLEVELCWNRVRGPLELRGWRSGDAYWPQGRNRVHQVREIFQDLRIPSWRRSGWPILSYRSATGHAEILWTRGLGGARELLADAEAGPVLRISEKQESFVTGIASY